MTSPASAPSRSPTSSASTRHFREFFTVAGRTLYDAIELESGPPLRLSSVELPAGVLKIEGAELGEDEAKELVAGFQAARREERRRVPLCKASTTPREKPLAGRLATRRSRARANVRDRLRAPIQRPGFDGRREPVRKRERAPLLEPLAATRALDFLGACAPLPSHDPRTRSRMRFPAVSRSRSTSRHSYAPTHNRRPSTPSSFLTAGVITRDEARARLPRHSLELRRRPPI